MIIEDELAQDEFLGENRVGMTKYQAIDDAAVAGIKLTVDGPFRGLSTDRQLNQDQSKRVEVYIDFLTPNHEVPPSIIQAIQNMMGGQAFSCNGRKCVSYYNTVTATEGAAQRIKAIGKAILKLREIYLAK